MPEILETNLRPAADSETDLRSAWDVDVEKMRAERYKLMFEWELTGHGLDRDIAAQVSEQFPYLRIAEAFEECDHVGLRLEDGEEVVALRLLRGGFALISACVYWRCAMFDRWAARKPKRPGSPTYAVSTRTNRLLHRHVVFGEGAGEPMLDHRNSVGLDCRLANLRFCTSTENAQNRKPSTGRWKGVRKMGGGRYAAKISANRVQYSLGSFPTPEAAARAYDAAARSLHGEFARLNFPNEQNREAR